MSNRISIEEVSHQCIGNKGVNPVDYDALARLATIFYGLTHVDESPSSAREISVRRFCILSAIRIMAEMKTLIAARGF